jgi:hypothetical protein
VLVGSKREPRRVRMNCVCVCVLTCETCECCVCCVDMCACQLFLFNDLLLVTRKCGRVERLADSVWLRLCVCDRVLCGSECAVQLCMCFDSVSPRTSATPPAALRVVVLYEHGDDARSRPAIVGGACACVCVPLIAHHALCQIRGVSRYDVADKAASGSASLVPSSPVACRVGVV